MLLGPMIVIVKSQTSKKALTLKFNISLSLYQLNFMSDLNKLKFACYPSSPNFCQQYRFVKDGSWINRCEISF